MKRLVAALVFVVATSVSAFAQSFPVPSGWQNQRDSDMKLYSITPAGEFTGIYFNRAAGFACQYGPNNGAGERPLSHFQRRVEQRHCELQFQNRMERNAAGYNAEDDMGSDRTRNPTNLRH